MIEPQQLHKHIESALFLGERGKYSACRQELRTLYYTIKKDSLILWNNHHISQLGKAIILMIHLDLFDDEDQNIGLAHLAYLYISRGLVLEQQKDKDADISEIFRMLKDRVILLKSFDDFFVESLIAFYFSDQKATNRDHFNEQRKAVLSRMPLMQFADLFLIEQYFKDLKNDDFLLELSNLIEHDYQIGEKELKEALLLHKILFKHTYDQIKEGTLYF